jgi:hypothetical protein
VVQTVAELVQLVEKPEMVGVESTGQESACVSISIYRMPSFKSTYRMLLIFDLGWPRRNLRQVAFEIRLHISIVVDLAHNISQAPLRLLRVVWIAKWRNQKTVAKQKLLVKGC